MAESAPADTLRAAIKALYGPDPGAQQHANQWLNSFNTQPAAWEACLQLVDPAGDADVSFFCSNALLTKVRAEWHKLSGEQQGQLASAIGGRFKAFLGHNHSQAKLATQRLGLALAAIASLSGAQACQQFATECLGMVSVGSHMHVVECALLMLGALADELGNMDSSRRQGLVQATTSQWTNIMHMVQALIPQQMAAGNYGLVHGALHCLQCWLKLDPQGTSCRVSPGELYSSHPSLLSVLFSIIGAEAAEAVTAERLEAMSTEVLSDLLRPGGHKTDSALERAALDASIQALLQLRDRALMPGEAGTGTAKAVCTLASVVAERDYQAAAGGSAYALPLAALMLQCASRPERCVAEASVEYFLMLNTVLVEERAPELGAPLFGQLAPALFRHACYSGGFTSWDEEEEDEEAFTRFREQGLLELLETVYEMMGLPFLVALRDSLRAGSSWQEAEGALYCLQAVHTWAKKQAEVAGSVGQETNEVLLSIFSELCSPNSAAAPSLAHTLVCQTAAGAIGAYAAWFASTDASPLEGALQLLLHALAHRESWQSAAQAFRALCTRCAARLAGSAALMGLMEVAARVVAPLATAGQVCCRVSMDWEDRAAVQEGLARAITTLPPADAADAATRLLAPHLTRAQSIVAYGGASNTHHAANGTGAAVATSNGSSSAAHTHQQQPHQHQQQHQGHLVLPTQQQLLDTLADELRLVAAIIRCMEFPGETSLGMAHPAIRLLEASWPLLTAVAESPLCQQDPGLIQAVCAVYNRAVQSAKGAAKALLPMLLRSVLDIFVKHHHPACLDTIATVMVAYGEVDSVPEVADMQRQALAGAAAAADGALRARAASGQVLAASGDLLRGLLAMADTHIIFARDMLLSSASLPVFVEWGIAAMGLREQEPAEPAFAFMGHLLGALVRVQGTGDAASDAVTAAVTGVIAAGTEALVRTLLLGICDTCPRKLLRWLATILASLLANGSLAPAAAQWLLQGLQAHDLPGRLTALVCLAWQKTAGMSAGLLRPEDCQTFAKLVLRQPPLNSVRFYALILDFAAIARGEGTSDVLLAYEM